MTSRATQSASDASREAPAAEPAGRPYYVLDPRTIGRPIHLIDKFTAQIRDDLTAKFCAPLNRRYRASFEIGQVSLVHSSTLPPQQRRLNYQSEMGRICFAPAREVLLCILGYRFGTLDSEDCASTAPASASEERLTATLGSQLVNLVAGRIEAAQPRAAEGGAEPRAAVSADALPEDSWTLRVEVAERARQVQGVLWFVLDAACMEQLLNGLSQARARAALQKGTTPVQPLPTRLQFTLVARLLDTEISLGVLLDTRIGDVIPVRLRGADVLIGSSRLFTASIAEHRGKLCLTSFEDVE